MRKIGMFCAAAMTVATAWAGTSTWCSTFSDCKEKSDAEHRPLVLVWGNSGCGYCDLLKQALETSAVKTWMKSKDTYVFCKCTGKDTTDGKAAWEFAREAGGNIIREYPFVKVYYPKTDGTTIATNFTGRTGKMPSTTGTLAKQFMTSVDDIVGSEEPSEESDVGFVVADTEYDRLEAEPQTSYVDVPLQRTATEKETCTLKAAYPSGTEKTYKVTFAANQLEALVRVAVPQAAAGRETALTLYDASGTKIGTSAIHHVDTCANSATNPAWLGEAWSYGDWTMDLDSALSATAAVDGKAYTLVYFTGALWCPWCQRLDAGVLSQNAFTDWARANNVALAELDNPKRTDAPPTLLRYAAGNNSYIGKSVSGASYLSRKSISEEDGEKVIARNHELGYEGGLYCAPEAARTGYPSLILLRKDGTVAGRFNGYVDGTNPYDTEENLARLDDLLLLAEGDGDERDNYLTTTRLDLAAGETAETTLQINDRKRWYHLSGLEEHVGDFVIVNASGDRDVQLTITNAAASVGRVVATGENTASLQIPRGGDLYVLVESFTEAEKYGASTSFDVSLESKVDAQGEEDVVAIKKLSKSAVKALNPCLYAKYSGVQIPLCEATDDGDLLRGIVTWAQTSANRISAKLSYKSGSTVSCSGTWSEIGLASGTAYATLKAKGSTVKVSMDACGNVTLTAALPEMTITGEGCVEPTASFTDFAGTYTVTMPQTRADETSRLSGATVLTLRMTASAAKRGTVTVSGTLPDGTAFSASSTLIPMGDGSAMLPVLKINAKYNFGALLKILPNASETWGTLGGMQTVLARENSVAYADYAGEEIGMLYFDVYGGYFKSGVSAKAACTDFGLDTKLCLSVPGMYDCETLTATGTGFKISPPVTGLTLKYNRKTGVITGTGKMVIGNVTHSTTIAAVVLPGWSDCHCGEEKAVERPFATGTFYWKSEALRYSRQIDIDYVPEN